jgi:hypothetical protein
VISDGVNLNGTIAPNGFSVPLLLVRSMYGIGTSKNP